MGDQINDSARLISCSFCDEKCSPLAIGEHLMMCGNKTDQCPNCRKYIRRAIFAYHYENNCANLEESDTDVKAPANLPDASSTFQPDNSSPSPSTFQPNNPSQSPSTFQPNNPSPSPSRSTVEKNNYRTEIRIDLPAHSGTQDTAAQRFGSVTTTSVCPYCNFDWDLAESEAHQENCLQNPKNIAKRQQSRNNPTSTQNSGLDRLNYVDEPKDAVEIPCEVCNKTIKWCDYRNHMQVCTTQLYPRIHEPQHAYRMDAPNYARCRYCDKKYMIATLEMHQTACKKSPVNITLEEQHRGIFSLPRPRIPFFDRIIYPRTNN